MSGAYGYQYRLAREAERRIRLARIRETTERFYHEYRERMAQLRQEGLDRYVSEEIARMEEQLDRLSAALVEAPEEAQRISFQIGREIGALSQLAHNAHREFEARERQRQRHLAEMRRRATSELERFLEGLMDEITDPIEQDFAFEQIEALRSTYEGRVVDPTELTRIKEEVEERIRTIRAEATEAANAWKERKRQETAREAQRTRIEIHRKVAEADRRSHPETTETILRRLDDLERRVPETQSPETSKGGCDPIDQELESATVEIDEAVTEEACRREVVRAILESLRKAGFVVDPPKRRVQEKDEVLIRARKPSGAQAAFRVDADGTMIYKFDRYEGMKCKEDIDQVLPRLSEIYGIELSDERVLWQNPERISKSARPIGEGTKGKRHG